MLPEKGFKQGRNALRMQQRRFVSSCNRNFSGRTAFVYVILNCPAGLFFMKIVDVKSCSVQYMHMHLHGNRVEKIFFCCTFDRNLQKSFFNNFRIQSVGIYYFL